MPTAYFEFFKNIWLTLANGELFVSIDFSCRACFFLFLIFFLLFLIKQLVHEKRDSKHRTLSHRNVNIKATRIAAQRIQCVCVCACTRVQSLQIAYEASDTRHWAHCCHVHLVTLQITCNVFRIFDDFYLLDFKQLQRVLKSRYTNSVTFVLSRTAHHHHHTYNVQRSIHRTYTTSASGMVIDNSNQSHTVNQTFC